MFGFIPGSSLLLSAVADLISSVVNSYTGVSFVAPAMVALERDVLRWLCEVMGMPAGAGGILTSGGSMATLSALLCARTERLKGDPANARIYLTAHTHYCVAKAARIIGFPPGALRSIAVDAAQRMDVAALRAAVQEDRSNGLQPLCVVGTAGTTSTGAIDPLDELAAIAREQDLWFHVDAAYGGFFQLTARGRARFGGIGQADSIVLDPHKGLFLPFGTGSLLVRERDVLRRAHSASDKAYLRDVADEDENDFADTSPELTRPNRGLRMWLPLQVHGVAAFRDMLDDKLDLAEYACARLSGIPGIEVLEAPQLSIVVFRCLGAGVSVTDANLATDSLVQRVNSGGVAFLSSTRLGQRVVARLAVLNLLTTAEDIDTVIGQIAAASSARYNAACQARSASA
ncbi:aminotransferase class V-fold PLP-dependent enzyme [Duganella callida]|uniref:Aminotransferase class V-fold PLP-dependent enzyme n=2 Tax=Duganella callida TaxID=2561932 RepID=A0A4Y9SXS8_9BURK|nr:aminotransferase class V-fold PLP-dependent enzyme [Duganella callida]